MTHELSLPELEEIESRHVLRNYARLPVAITTGADVWLHTVDGRRVLTSDQAVRLTELPRSAVVLGGGVIGVEFASAWRSFGVEVTVVTVAAASAASPGVAGTAAAACVGTGTATGAAV